VKLRRAVVALAAVTAAGVVLAGCSAPTGSEISEKTSLSIASNSAVTSLNPLVANQYSTYNSNVAYMYQGVASNYSDATPKLVTNPKFGTYKKLSSDPLKVQFTLSDNAKWSDGDPINGADMLLQWASNISKYNNPKSGANFSSINAGSGFDGITEVSAKMFAGALMECAALVAPRGARAGVHGALAHELVRTARALDRNPLPVGERIPHATSV